MGSHIDPFADWTLDEKKAFVQNEVEARQECFAKYDKKQEQNKNKALAKANKTIKQDAKKAS